MRIRALAAAVALAVLVLPAFAHPAEAAFTAGTAGAATFTAAVVAAPTGLSASRPCTRATPQYVNKQGYAFTNASTYAIDLPSGSVAGDLLLAVVGTNATSATLTAPTGWTSVAAQSTAGGRSAVFVHQLASGETGPFTFGGFANVASLVLLTSYRGVDPARVVGGAAGTTSLSMVAPSVTSTVTNALIVNAWVANAYSGTMTSPAQLTTVSSYAGGSPLIAETLGYRTATAAASGTATLTLSGSAPYGEAFTVALAGAPDPTVHLTWTAPAQTFVTGYAWSRDGVGLPDLLGRTTVTAVDSALGAASSAVYSVRSTAGTWSSTAVVVAVGACP